MKHQLMVLNDDGVNDDEDDDGVEGDDESDPYRQDTWQNEEQKTSSNPIRETFTQEHVFKEEPVLIDFNPHLLPQQSQ